MNLDQIIKKNIINLHLKAKNKKQAIEELTNLLVQEGVIASGEGFIEDVYEREAQGKTGIGNYIAIPHGKSDSVIQTSIAIGRTEQDIEWETLDDQPVRCILLFAVRKADQDSIHIKLLAKVAGALAEDEVCEALLHGENPEEIVNIFHAFS